MQKILELIMSSKDVTVGGGCAAAVSGAMAAGLTGMVARLSVEKNGKKYGLPDEEYLSLADELDKLVEELKQGATDDAEAYSGIKNAYSMPKDTNEQKNARRAAIEAAAIVAADVPLQNATRAARVHEIVVKLKDNSNPNTMSDLVCGEMLSMTAMKGACLNIAANLPFIKTEAVQERFFVAIKSLETTILRSVKNQKSGGK